MMDGLLKFPIACRAHGPVTYRAHGTYGVWGEAGTWRLNDGQLTEVFTGFEPCMWIGHPKRLASRMSRPFDGSIRIVS
jgi:hypothetical protein